MALTSLLKSALPGKLDLSVDRGELFETWAQRWEDFALLANLQAENLQKQMAYFRHYHALHI